MEKILVAVDGSENADRALTKAKQIGTAFNSKITILHVIKDLANPDTFYMTYATGHDITVQKKLEEESGKLLETYIENTKDYTGELDTLTRSGKPGDTITKVAADGNYDLIVMGNRGLGVFAGAMMGSVSNKVVNRSETSVLIVK